MDEWDTRAETLLTQFPRNWSPSCILVTDAVAAELRKLGETNEELKAQILMLKAENEHIKSVDFPRRAESIARANYLKGLEASIELIRHVNPGGRFHWEGYEQDAIEPIQSRIDKIKAEKK